jgi:hypothetical protein
MLFTHYCLVYNVYMNRESVIYSDRPRFETGVRQIYIAIPVFLIVLAAIPLFLKGGPNLHEKLNFLAIYVVIGISTAVLFRLTIPREYRIMEDRLRIAGGFNTKRDRLFSDIDSITYLDKANVNQLGQILSYSRETMIYPNRNVIVVKTRDGKITFLSPRNAKTFYEKLSGQIRVHNENGNST